MANRSVNEYHQPINNPCLSDVLLKLEALSHITLTQDFLKTPTFIQHDYFWVMNELIATARTLSEYNDF